MLADMEFEVKEEEPWYSKQQDLEHDLHLAAELGKTLLERNRELEQGLQQMYSTNREQLQEIEYLTKQVDLLRQVNDQHAKVYEQLDVSSRELEQSNRKLSQDNKAAQEKIQGLTETVDGLQNQVAEMKRQMEKMKMGPSPSQKHKELLWRPHRTHSVSCLNELQKKHSEDPSDDDPHGGPPRLSWREEEQASLRRSLRSLQTQLASERAQREAAEREADLLASDNAALEQQLRMMEGCQARLVELESEAVELRQLWRAESRSEAAGHVGDVRPGSAMAALDCVFLLHSEDESTVEDSSEVEEDDDCGDETPSAIPPHYCDGFCRKKSDSSSSDGSSDRCWLHERACTRRSDTVKYRGISLLNEVDAQYSALQAKYDELLSRCRQGEEHEDPQESHNKAVQTAPGSPPLSHGRAAGTDGAGMAEDDFHQPEYKALFREIFTCIQKTKEDLSENRGKPAAAAADDDDDGVNRKDRAFTC